jgi:hypothetical protein
LPVVDWHLKSLSPVYGLFSFQIKQATAPESAAIIQRFAYRANGQLADDRWKIHKFGGSSLADADCFARVAGLMIERPGERVGVVVS